VSNEKRDCTRVRQHEALQYRSHKWISRSILQEAVDPPLKSAVQRELRTEDLVLRKDQEQASNGNSQADERQRISSSGVRLSRHGLRAIVIRSGTDPTKTISQTRGSPQIGFSNKSASVLTEPLGIPSSEKTVLFTGLPKLTKLY